MIPDRPPFFRAGRGEPTAGCISGPLIFDSGEAENTFFFRCQDRLLVYNTLCGIRSILFVMDREHRDRYTALLMDLAARLALVAERTGLPLPTTIEPYFIPLNVDTLAVYAADFFFDQTAPSGSLVFNQVSPACARIFTQWQALAGKSGAAILTPEDLSRLRRLGELALRFHDKAEYVRLTKADGSGLPAHARTIVLEIAEFLALDTWEDIRSLFAARNAGPPPAAFFAKSSRDSGGNLSARLTRDDCAETLGRLKREFAKLSAGIEECISAMLLELRRDVALAPSIRHVRWTDARLLGYLKDQLARRKGVKVLIQENVEGSSEALFQGIGLACETGSDQSFATGQLYRDKERRHFLGSYIREDVSASIMSVRFANEIASLVALFSREGYEGPLGFDARLGPDGRWVPIYDCNPRLTAVYPGLAVFQFLRRTGFRCESAISLGYRGEWDQCTVPHWLDRLESRGLLYTGTSGGVLPLPNLSRDDGCDLLILNFPPLRLPQVLSAAGIEPAHFASIF